MSSKKTTISNSGTHKSKSYFDSANLFSNTSHVKKGASFAGCALIGIYSGALIGIYSGPLWAMATQTLLPALVYPIMTGSMIPSTYSASTELFSASLRKNISIKVCVNGYKLVGAAISFMPIVNTVIMAFSAVADASIPIVSAAAKSAIRKTSEIVSTMTKSPSSPWFFSRPIENNRSHSSNSRQKLETIYEDREFISENTSTLGH